MPEAAVNGALNVEVLSDYYKKAGFDVRETERDTEGVFRFEYNFPNDVKATAMRAAFAKNGGDMQTYYRYVDRPHNRGEVQSRERVVIMHESEEELRKFFNDVLDDYTRFMDESAGAEEGSSYNVTSKKRNLAGRV